MKRFRYKNLVLDLPGREVEKACANRAVTLATCGTCSAVIISNFRTRICCGRISPCALHTPCPTIISACGAYSPCPAMTHYTCQYGSLPTTITTDITTTPQTGTILEQPEQELDIQALKAELKAQLVAIEEMEAQEKAALTVDDINQLESQLKGAMEELEALKAKAPK
jgi:hypothetical protein